MTSAPMKDIAQACEKDGYKFSALLAGVVQSDAFQKRRIPTEEELKELKADPKTAKPADKEKRPATPATVAPPAVIAPKKPR